MQIDGYTPADPHIATEVGVELEYSTKFGKIHIRARSTGKDNTEFRKAAEKLNRRREISEKLALAARVMSRPLKRVANPVSFVEPPNCEPVGPTSRPTRERRNQAGSAAGTRTTAANRVARRNTRFRFMTLFIL